MNLEQLKAELNRLQVEAMKLNPNSKNMHSIAYMALFGRICRLQGAIEVLENGFLL